MEKDLFRGILLSGMVVMLLIGIILAVKERKALKPYFAKLYQY